MDTCGMVPACPIRSELSFAGIEAGVLHTLLLAAWAGAERCRVPPPRVRVRQMRIHGRCGRRADRGGGASRPRPQQHGSGRPCARRSDDPLATLTALWLLQQPVRRSAFDRALPRLVDPSPGGHRRESAGEVVALIDVRPYASDDGASGWVVSDLSPHLDTGFADAARFRARGVHGLDHSGPADHPAARWTELLILVPAVASRASIWPSTPRPWSPPTSTPALSSWPR